MTDVALTEGTTASELFRRSQNPLATGGMTGQLGSTRFPGFPQCHGEVGVRCHGLGCGEPGY
jgi:hypothetical protein